MFWHFPTLSLRTELAIALRAGFAVGEIINWDLRSFRGITSTFQKRGIKIMPLLLKTAAEQVWVCNKILSISMLLFYKGTLERPPMVLLGYQLFLYRRMYIALCLAFKSQLGQWLSWHIRIKLAHLGVWPFHCFTFNLVSGTEFVGNFNAILWCLAKLIILLVRQLWVSYSSTGHHNNVWIPSQSCRHQRAWFCCATHLGPVISLYFENPNEHNTDLPLCIFALVDAQLLLKLCTPNCASMMLIPASERVLASLLSLSKAGKWALNQRITHMDWDRIIATIQNQNDHA